MKVAQHIAETLRLTKRRTLVLLALVALGFVVCVEPSEAPPDDSACVGESCDAEECLDGASCSVGKGECKSDGVLVCDGDTRVCDAVLGLPTDEICDGLDNDCDGQVDEDFDVGAICTLGTGVCARTGTIVCQPMGFSACNVVAEEPTEIDEVTCDDLDNDCDGVVDEGCDEDGDGFCDSDRVVDGTPAVCPKGGGDCVDTAAHIYPGAVEVCDGRDNDCDGEVDNNPSNPQTFYADCDGDTYPMLNAETFVGCKAPERDLAKAACGNSYWARWVTNTPVVDDCNDYNYEVFPGRGEYFATPIEQAREGLEFDYDCSAAHEKRWKEINVDLRAPCPSSTVYTLPVPMCAALVNPSMNGVSGWVGDNVPECGEVAEFTICTYIQTGGNTCTGTRIVVEQKQECR